MKDASKQRRSLGKLGIIAAAAVILPLTATIVPAINAHDGATAAADEPVVRKKVKIIRINKDGKNVHVITKGAGGEVTKVERGGKIFVFRTDKKLSEEEVEAMIGDAQESREAAEEASIEAEEARIDAEAAQGEAEAARGNAEAMRGHAEAMRAHAVAMAVNYIPEIDIREITKNCREGQPVTTNVEGFDGTSKSRIKIVMCGKGQAKVARMEALNGLREARTEIAAEKDMPDSVRKDVIERLEKQIRKMEADVDKAG